jgi:hypothetical protein
MYNEANYEDTKNAKTNRISEAYGTASFVVAFTEYPPDLKGFRVRVSARAVTAPTAAR